MSFCFCCEGGENLQNFLVLPQGFKSFHTVFSQARRHTLVRVGCGVCKWLSQWWLVFVLMEVDATLGVGCGIWQHFHSFREIKCLQGIQRLYGWVCEILRLPQSLVELWIPNHGYSQSAGSQSLVITACSQLGESQFEFYR